MKNMNIQRMISIMGILFYVIITYYIYLLIRQNYIFINCEVIAWWLHVWYVRSLLSPGSICFWYPYLFEKISIYIYFLFLWISLFPFICKKFTRKKTLIFMFWIIVFISTISIIWAGTPLFYMEQLPDLGNN